MQIIGGSQTGIVFADSANNLGQIWKKVHWMMVNRLKGFFLSHLHQKTCFMLKKLKASSFLSFNRVKTLGLFLKIFFQITKN